MSYLVNTYVNRGLNIVRGKGVFLFDEKGKKYLDFGGNYGVCILGYSNKTLLKALISQLENLYILHGSFNSSVRDQAAKTVCEKTGFSQVFFSNSGSEAIEAALKFAVLAKGKKHFIAMSNSYHGKTLGSLSATYTREYKDSFKPLLWDFSFAKFNNIDSVKSLVTKNTCGILVEPVQGEGGINIADKKFLAGLKNLCKAEKILLIFDEIQSGCGRTGNFLSYEKSGVKPDILCLGKGIAGGIPAGVTLINEGIAKHIGLHIHTSTFGGNPLACAGVVATLSVLNEKMLESVRIKGKYFLSKLKEIKSSRIGDIRGIGLMVGVEIKGNLTQVLKGLQNRGIIALPSGSGVVRFIPPYQVSKKHIDFVVKNLERVLNV